MKASPAMAPEVFISIIFNQLLLFIVFTGLVALMSFTQTDFQKTLVGKWRLETIESPGQPPMNVKDVLGDMFLEFKNDFTYIESGVGNDKKGTWKITNAVYLQMKRDTQTDYTEKEKLREISTDKIEMTHEDKKKFIFTFFEYRGTLEWPTRCIHNFTGNGKCLCKS